MVVNGMSGPRELGLLPAPRCEVHRLSQGVVCFAIGAAYYVD